MCIGEFKHTMIRSFHKGAFFRQWLMRPNTPPIIRYCQELIDNTYNFRSSAPPPLEFSEDDVDDHLYDDDLPNKIKCPLELAKLLGYEEKSYWETPFLGFLGGSSGNPAKSSIWGSSIGCH